MIVSTEWLMWGSRGLRMVADMRKRQNLRGIVTASIPVVVAVALAVSGCAAEPEARTSTPAASNPAEPIKAPTLAEAEPSVPEVTNPGLDQAALDERLRQAAWANNLSAAEQLIDWGADVNAQDVTQQSAFLISTSEGHLELLQLMLAHGADVHALDSWNGTGLIRAAERGHWAVIGELVQAGVPLDHMNRVGYQGIHEAVWMGRDDATYFATVRVLYAAGADFSTPSANEGLSPLQMADYRGFGGQGAVLRELLNEPIPAEPTEALLAAAEAGNAAGVATALRAGADGLATSADGQTAFEIAEAGQHIAAQQVLEALGFSKQSR